MVRQHIRMTDRLEGTIGSGLLVGTGDTLNEGTYSHSHSDYNSQDFVGGPLGLLLGYIYVGTQSRYLKTPQNKVVKL